MSSVHCGHRRLCEGEMDQVGSINTDQAVSLCVVETRTLLQYICVSQICHTKANMIWKVIQVYRTWKWSHSSPHSYRRHQAEVSHRLYVFGPCTTGRPGERYWCPLRWKPEWAWVSVWTQWGEKNILPLPGIEPRFFGCLAHSLVTEPTMKAANVPISCNT